MLNNMTKQITGSGPLCPTPIQNVEYQILQHADGSTSCDCLGWCRRVAADGSRSCKHVRAVDMGTADRTCKATHSYENHQPRNHQQASTKGNNANYRTFEIARLGQRKFAV